jgi:hypothetical protein
MVLDVKLANANYMFLAFADPATRAILEHLARWQRNQSRAIQKPHYEEQKG